MTGSFGRLWQTWPQRLGKCLGNTWEMRGKWMRKRHSKRCPCIRCFMWMHPVRTLSFLLFNLEVLQKASFFLGPDRCHLLSSFQAGYVTFSDVHQRGITGCSLRDESGSIKMHSCSCSSVFALSTWREQLEADASVQRHPARNSKLSHESILPMAPARNTEETLRMQAKKHYTGDNFQKCV